MRENRPLVALMIAILALPLSGVIQACHKVPMTDRRQLLIVPEGTENTLGAQAYNDILAEEKLSSNKAASDMLTRVGKRIAAVTGEKGYEWEYKLIASDAVNAFCLPGGKVAFYEGILPACSSEGGLAVVMGHEIGHAIARHGGERMSQNILVQMGGLGVDVATRNKTEQKRLILLGAYGAAATYGYVLPFSRRQESEADHIGLMYMAMAGYDPAEAPKFWNRMQEEGGGGVPAFLSTHPSHEKRAAELNDLMSEAKKLYNQSSKKYGTGDPVPGASSGSKSSGSSDSGSKSEPVEKGEPSKKKPSK